MHGEEVGITTKRLPLKNKNIGPKPTAKPESILVSGYVPHKSFFSQPLVPVHTNKLQPWPETHDLEVNNKLREVPPTPTRVNGRLKARSHSTTHLKNTWRKRKEDYNQLGKVEGSNQMVHSVKKSFSDMLRNCHGAHPNERLNPLLH